MLKALIKAPYEPTADADLKALSLKTAFLLVALCSAKQVGELCALSVTDDCLRWSADGTGVLLWPYLPFLLKVLNPQSANRVLEVGHFQPSSSPKSNFPLGINTVILILILILRQSKKSWLHCV